MHWKRILIVPGFALWFVFVSYHKEKKQKYFFWIMKHGHRAGFVWHFYHIHLEMGHRIFQ